MNNIRKYRVKREMTLRQLAQKSGISAGYLSHLEKGSRVNPSREVMENISVVLRYTVSDIFFPN